MANYDFECNIELDQAGNSTPDVVQPLIDALRDISDGNITLNPLAAPPSSTALARVLLGVSGGGVNFAWGSPTQTALPGDNLLFFHPFGFECQEFASWWYEGGGAALHRSLTDTAGIDLVQFPAALRAPEGGGWYKEAVNLKKLLDGKWSDGTDISIRMFGEAEIAHDRAFPLVDTPSPTPTVSFLGDVFTGKYNAGEFSEPYGDASAVNGLFPNWPLVDGSIITGGLKHYYMASWHSPFRARVLWVNKPFYDALPANDKVRIEVAARASALQNIAMSLKGQDAVIKAWQDMGAIIHEQFPMDVMDRLRTAMDSVLDDYAAANPTTYGAILDSQRAYMRANQVRWRSAFVDRRWRFQRTIYENDLHTDARF